MATPPLESIDPREVVGSLAATESTAATVVMVAAEQTLEWGPSVTVAKVEAGTCGLPTHKTKPIEVARLGSILVANPAPKLKNGLVYSAV